MFVLRFLSRWLLSQLVVVSDKFTCQQKGGIPFQITSISGKNFRCEVPRLQVMVVYDHIYLLVHYYYYIFIVISHYVGQCWMINY